MSKTNCKSCGGPLDIAESKCPFCGTKNINLTDIDLASGEAANFIFRMPHNIAGVDGSEVYMSVLAVPELGDIQIADDYADITGRCGATIARYKTSSTFEMGLNLRAVSRSEKDEIYRLTYNKN